MPAPKKLILLVIGIFFSSLAFTQSLPVVNALLFYSPTCSHCHKVINEDLPHLTEKYGGQLVILGINIATEEGSTLFWEVLEFLEIKPEDAAVPFLLVGETILIGSEDIPGQLPTIVEQSLPQGGIDWSQIPAVQDFLKAQGILAPQDQIEPKPNHANLEAAVQSFESLSFYDRFRQDTIGNSLSVLMLIWIAFVLIRSVLVFTKPLTPKPWPGWATPLLVAAGVSVALYLSFVEVTDTQAVCGPVGDCNTVQQSEYAFLFGILPVGLLGLFGYIAIVLTWGFTQLATGGWIKRGTIALLAITASGTLFSAYLTFLEPFVIGATCLWCLSSAALMTLLFWDASNRTALHVKNLNQKESKL